MFVSVVVLELRMLGLEGGMFEVEDEDGRARGIAGRMRDGRKEEKRERGPERIVKTHSHPKVVMKSSISSSKLPPATSTSTTDLMDTSSYSRPESG